MVDRKKLDEILLKNLDKNDGYIFGCSKNIDEESQQTIVDYLMEKGYVFGPAPMWYLFDLAIRTRRDELNSITQKLMENYFMHVQHVISVLLEK